MVTFISLSKLWPGELLKCLYMGRLVFVLLAALWPAILLDSDLLVCPTYLFILTHLVHSRIYITFFVLQFVCFGVENDLWL